MPVQCTCEHCATVFFVKPSRFARGNVHFCSRACSDIAKNQRPEDMWRFVDLTESCWIWTGTILATGYGQIRCSGEKYLAHRLSWLLAYGAIPDDLFVCHQCDNPPCVRPDHLFLGYPADNSADMVLKERQARGEQVWCTKLTAKQVTEIRRLADAGIGHYALAEQFSVSRTLIGYIVNRRIWKHVA